MPTHSCQYGRLPDFIIGGAPKCGTTSLHFILDQNQDISMPEQEVHFFDADDPITHPDFLGVDSGQLRWLDVGTPDDETLKWYAGQFAPHTKARLIGEDSTTYIFSEVAAARIAALLPEVKLIFVLRDPVKRAYSQYWHLVRSARISTSFETAISAHTSIILGSTYAPHLRRYIEMFGRDRVRIVLFEEFLADQQGTIDQLTDYLGAERFTLSEGKTWFNRTYYPTKPRLQNLINRVGSPIVSRRYRHHMGAADTPGQQAMAKLHYRWFRYINPILLKDTKPPPMQAETHKYLTQHLRARNEGLEAICGKTLGALWPTFADNP
ncbi:MAG: sulfotransferase [Pseudomonadota bacterium]